MQIFRFILRVFTHYTHHKDRASAAALAYYAVFALAPILLIILTIVGQFIGVDTAIRDQLIDQLANNVDASVTRLVLTIVEELNDGVGITLARIIGFGFLTLAVAALIGYLQQSLNTLFATDIYHTGFARWMRLQVLSWIVMIVFGGLWVASLVVELIARWIQGQIIELPLWIGEIGGFAWVVIFLMCLFQVLIIHSISFKNLLIGGVVTAGLLRLARIGFNWYVAISDVASAYGATASIIAFLLWLYVSAHIIYIGASLMAVLENKDTKIQD